MLCGVYIVLPLSCCVVCIYYYLCHAVWCVYITAIVMLCGVYILLLLSCGCVVYICCSCNRLNWGALHAWSAPQLSLLQLSCTLLPSSPLAYPTDSTILLLTYRQQSTSIIYTVLLLSCCVVCIHCVFVAYVQSFSLDPLEPHDIAKVSYNRIKNRFANIFPCELFPIALYMSCLHNESHSAVNNPSLFSVCS